MNHLDDILGFATPLVGARQDCFVIRLRIYDMLQELFSYVGVLFGFCLKSEEHIFEKLVEIIWDIIKGFEAQPRFTNFQTT